MKPSHTSRRRSHEFGRQPLRVVLTLLGWAVAASAEAQTTAPNPAPPPQTPVEASLPRQEEPGRWSPWSVGLSANQGYEGGNAGAVDGISNTRISTDLQAQIGRSWLLRRGSINFSGTGGQTRYQERQNQFMYGFGVATSHQFTRRFTHSAAVSASRSYAEDSSLLVNAGVVLPRVVTENQAFGTGMNYQLSRQNSIEASVTGSRVSFPSAAALPTTSSYSLRGAYSRELNRTHSIGVSLGNTITTGVSGDVQGLAATYNGRFGRGVTLIANGGIKPYRTTDGSKLRFAPGALLGVSMATLRNQSLTASYEHTVEQAYGLTGTRLCHRFNSAYSLGFGRLIVDGNVNYALNTHPDVVDFTLVGWTAGVSARYTIIRNLSVGATYNYAVSQQTGLASVQTSRGGISIGYGFTWR